MSETNIPEQPASGSSAVSGSVTVAYDIVNDDAWRDGGNPLKWEHHGLKAHTVAVYDAFERLEVYREALEKIADMNTNFPSLADAMSKIAAEALERAQNGGAERPAN